MSAFLSPLRSRSLLESLPVLGISSTAGGLDSRLIDDRLEQMRVLLSGAVGNLATVRDSVDKNSDIRAQLQSKIASLKRITATVGMYFYPSWRIDLFNTLDRLLDPDDWDLTFILPSEQSFSTFLRMMIYLHPSRRPGLGLSPMGHFLAAWTSGRDRIVIECIASDEVRWVLSRSVAGERESGAGKVLLHRVPDVTAPYEPEKLFQNGDKILA
jgi:hypothetical protein